MNSIQTGHGSSAANAGVNLSGLFTSVIALNCLDQISAARPMPHQRSLTHASFADPFRDLRSCSNLLDNLPSNATSFLVEGFGYNVNGQNLPCEPIYTYNDWAALRTAGNSKSCTAEVLTFTAKPTDAHIVFRGTQDFCNFAHKTVATAAALPGCDQLAQVKTYRKDASNSTLYHPRLSKTTWAEALYDTELAQCARSMLQFSAAKSMHRQLWSALPALIIGNAVISTVSHGLNWQLRVMHHQKDVKGLSFCCGAEYSLGYSFTPKGQFVVASAEVIKSVIIAGAQASAGSALLSDSAAVDGQYNPYAGYSSRDGFIQGAIGSLVLALPTLLPVFAGLAMEEEFYPGMTHDIEAVLRNSLVMSLALSFMNQLVAPSVGAGIHSSFDSEAQKPSESWTGALVGGFVTIALTPLLEMTLIRLAHALAATRERPSHIELT